MTCIARAALAATAFICAFAATGGSAQDVGERMPTLPCCHQDGQPLSIDLSTGQSVAPGGQDLFWTVISAPATVPTPTAYVITPISNWTAPAGAQWIGGTGSAPGGNYVYHLNFFIPHNPVLYQSLTLTLTIASDDIVTGAELNTIHPLSCGGCGYVSMVALTPSPPATWFKQGVNTLDVHVTNAPSSATGVVLSGRLDAVCNICTVQSSPPAGDHHH